MRVCVCVQSSATSYFLRAVLDVHDGHLANALDRCERARASMSTDFAALVRVYT